MDTVTGANTIIVRSSKNNPNYMLLRKLGTTDESIKKLLQDYKMNVVEDLSGGPKDFNLYVYNDKGQLYTSMTSFNIDGFNDIFNSIKSNNTSVQKGGDYYKYKYKKYKYKYSMIKKK